MGNSLKTVLQKHRRRIKRRIARYKKVHAWLRQKGLPVWQLRQRSTKLLTAGALAGALLLTPGGASIPKLTGGIVAKAFTAPLTEGEIKKMLSQALSSLLPKEPMPLNRETEEILSSLFQKYLKINTVSELEGNRLNMTYGYTGEEQHLKRYPGDTISNHDELAEIGMAPGLGAWGYWAFAKDSLTKEQILMEKYYIAAQTLYLSDWNTNQPYLKNWYRYRKVLVVNPANGQAAVAVIADSGPANWTGKQFGCSPELMHHLGLDVGMKKGAVVVFFVDDPHNQVPLGPIDS